MNYRDNGHHGLSLKDKLWATAAAYTKVDFYREMNELKHISKYVYNYLMKIDRSS
jgi:hypothetical protein